MYRLYSFDFLETISRQLFRAFRTVQATTLNTQALTALAAAQVAEKAEQGVYLLVLNGKPVYLGKANNVCERLAEHRRKLSGRRGIVSGSIAYKALLLDKSMSTAANETILMALFQRRHQGMWNNKGFGPKDPGKERDTTKPSAFDLQYPVRFDFPINDVSNPDNFVSQLSLIDDSETAASLFRKLKAQLPYVFRYGTTPAQAADLAATNLDLSGVPRNALDVLRAAIAGLPPGWQLAVLHFGIVVYKAKKIYTHAQKDAAGVSIAFVSPP